MRPSRRAAVAATIAALAVLAAGALSFGAPSATATGGLSPLELAQVQRDNCRIQLAHATSSAQRSRAQNCIADQTVIINALTVSPSPSGSPSPTPPGPTATPTPTTPAPTTPPPTTPPPTTVPPSPTPTPTPTGPAGFPTPGDTAAGSTGWRHTGVTLTPKTGLMRITTPGAVVDSVLAVDGIEVQANNVTISRSWVQGAGTGPGAGIWIDDGITGTTIVDTEVSSRPSANDTVEASLVDRAITAGSGKHSSGITMLRVYAHHMIRGLQFSCGTVIADSWIGDEVNPSTDHMSAIGGDTCASFSLVVDHNTVRLSPDDQNSAALLYYPPQVGAYGNQHVAITITNNFITGGTYCMWLSSDPQLDGSITVTGNRFGTDYYPACGRFGTTFTDALPSQHGPGPLTITWSDNLLGSVTVVAPHG